MNLIDCHSHTYHSPDAADSVLAMCEKAMSLGLKAYAVTDHCEVNRFYGAEHYSAAPKEYDTYHFDLDFEKAMQENLRIKDALAGKLNFLSGVELGQATFDLPVADKIAADTRLDFIIGSMHQVPDEDDFAFIDYSRYDAQALVGRYYEEVLRLCRWGKFDVLAHLTYPLRYIEGEKGVKVDLTPFEETIRAAFKILIQSGKGIEINTSGLRQKYGKAFPSLEYIQLFREMGGEILSLGSDAHCVADLGKGITEGAEMAKAAGFKHLCYFKERKPVFVAID